MTSAPGADAADLWSYAPIALWLGALLAVFKLSKFETKWAWLILACVYIELRGVLPDGRVTGLPVGAVAVLLSALFMQSPHPPLRPPRPLEQTFDEPPRARDEAADELMRTGTVDEALFRNFAEHLADDCASTVQWLERQLRVLLHRVQSGERLYLYRPDGLPELIVATPEDFRSWAETYFPGVRVG